MTLQPIAEHTFLIDAPGANVPVYRLPDGGAVLLDGGCAGDEDGILDALAGAGLHVAAVICSHAHVDHIALCPRLQERGVPVYVPAFEAACMASADRLKVWYPLFTQGQITHYFGKLLFTANRPFGPETEVLHIGGADFRLRRAPGHTTEQVITQTPDGVWYLADAALSRAVCAHAQMPYAFSVADTLTTLEGLRGLPGPVLLAHSGVEYNVDALVEDNLSLFGACARRVLALADRPMTQDALLRLAVADFGFHSAEKSFGLRVLDRNLRSFTDYLIDQGCLRQQVRDGQMLLARP